MKLIKAFFLSFLLLSQHLFAASVQLNWKDNSSNESVFVIERAPGGTNNFLEINTVPANVVNYTDNDVSNGVTYRYRVKARNTVGDSGYSNTVDATVPNAPVNTAPTIQDITAKTTTQNTPIDVAVNISDAETAASSLVVTATSSNTALVPNNNLAFSGSGGNRILRVTPANNQTGTSTINVTVSDGQLSMSDTFVLTVTAINTAPTISNITNKTTAEDTPITVNFTIGDAETPLNELQLGVLSSNSDIVVAESVVFGGSGANRTLVITPVENASGTTTITVGVGDGTLTDFDTFVLTVTAVNDTPIISSIDDIEIAVGNIAVVNFTVSDVETAANSLTITRASSNTALIPVNSIVVDGSGTNRILTLTPNSGITGMSTITVTVSDGSTSISKSFVLAVNQVVPDKPTGLTIILAEP